MFNLPDNAYQFWKDFQYLNKSFNFDHLKACKHTFKHPERSDSYTIYFTISHHVFTKTSKINDEAESKYPFPIKDIRTFNLKRYTLSFYLPDMLSTLPQQFCYHGGYGKYCTKKIKDEYGKEIHYKIIYRVWRERGKIRFHVQSAYPLDDPKEKVKKVNFWSICHNLVRGKKLPKADQ